MSRAREFEHASLISTSPVGLCFVPLSLLKNHLHRAEAVFNSINVVSVALRSHAYPRLCFTTKETPLHQNGGVREKRK